MNLVKKYFLFAVTTLTLMTLPAYAASLNGDFETGLQGWSIIKAPADYSQGEIEVQSDTAKVGTHALLLKGNTDKSLARVQSARIPIPEPRNLEFRGWYQFDAEPKAVVEIDVIFYDADGKLLDPMTKYWQRTRLDQSKDWREFHIPLTLNENAQSMHVTMYYVGGVGKVVLDDLQFAQLTPAVTPSTGYMLSGVDSAKALFSVESSLKKVYADSEKPARSQKVISLSAAKGETEAVQVVAWPKTKLDNISVTFSDLKSGAKVLSADALRARFVKSTIHPNQSPKGRAGAISDILSQSAPAFLDANKPQAIWVDVRVPRAAAAGIYQGSVQLKAGGTVISTLPIKIEVYDFALPEKPKFTTMAHGWGVPTNGVEVLWKNWREHRISGTASPIDSTVVANSAGWNGVPPSQNSADLPVQVSPEGDVSIDWTSWDKGTQKYFSTYGFTIFNVPNVFMGNWSGYITKKGGKGSWFELEVGTPVWKKAYSSYVKQVADHLREQGVLKQALWQIWDEPLAHNYPDVKMMADIIHEQAPDAQVLVTRQAVPELIGGPDIWVYPANTNNAQLTAQTDILKQVRAAGNQIWIYDNSLYTIDVDVTPFRLRTAPWVARQWDASGLLWWAVTYWQDGLQTSNGDGTLLYKNDTGNVDDTIRWENYRDGVEDYDYLWLLAEAQDAALKKLNNHNSDLSGEKLVRSLIKNIPAAEPNVSELYKLRASIAAAIVQLKKNPSAALTIKSTFNK